MNFGEQSRNLSLSKDALQQKKLEYFGITENAKASNLILVKAFRFFNQLGNVETGSQTTSMFLG